MSDFKQPTCGRMVHYFTNGEDLSIMQHKCPATVLNDEDSPNLFVMHIGGGGIRKNVPHKSIAGTKQAYWDWPEIK